MPKDNSLPFNPSEDDPIEILEREERKSLERAKRIRDLIQQARAQQPAPDLKVGIPPNAFRRMATAQALQLYLNLRGGKASLADAVRDLEAGGCRLGARPDTNIKITVGNRGQLFGFDDATDSVFLRYDPHEEADAKKRKRKA